MEPCRSPFSAFRLRPGADVRAGGRFADRPFDGRQRCAPRARSRSSVCGGGVRGSVARSWRARLRTGGRAGERPSPFSAPVFVRPSSFPLSLPESVGRRRRSRKAQTVVRPPSFLHPSDLLSARRRAAFVGRGRVIRRSEKESLERPTATGKGTN